ncbi:MAG TPA: hypothetical protein VF590_10650 [Isosphaeraceae bacterium]|jgi:hypothetical protein
MTVSEEFRSIAWESEGWVGKAYPLPLYRLCRVVEVGDEVLCHEREGRIVYGPAPRRPERV